MPTYVKAHRRGKSVVKAYQRAVKGSTNARYVLSKKLRAKYTEGFRRLKRQGYEPQAFVVKTVRRALGKKTSKYR